MTTDYHSAQEDFNFLISKLPPWVLSNFIMWLDIRVAEYKIFGRILSESEKNEARTLISGNSGAGALNSELNNQYSDGTVQSTPIPTHHQHRTEHRHMSQNSEHRLVHGHSGKIKHSPTIKRLPKFNDSNDQSKSNTHQIHTVQRSLQDQSRNMPGLELRIIESRGNVNTEEIHGTDDETRTPNVECINLDSDDEHEDEISRDPEDKKPDKELLMELANESNVIERETTQETQPSGLVSVIKLELPDNDVEHNQLDVAVPSSDRSVLDNLPVNPNIVRWQPSSSSDIEVVTPDADVIATIEKTLNTGQSEISEVNSVQHNEEKQNNGKFDIFDCGLCHGQFQTEVCIIRHLIKDHGIVAGKQSSYINPIYKCRFNCGTGFGSKLSRKQHEKIIHLAKSNICPFCNKTFGTKYVLDAHIRHHTGKKLKCATCEKTFLYPHSLKEHERCCEFGPGANQRFSCDLCTSGLNDGSLFYNRNRKCMFKSMKLLRQHLRMVHHHDNK